MSQDSQSRKWQITLNNPADKGLTHEVIKAKIQEIKSVKYYCLADEIGLETQTPHTHIFLYCSRLRFSTIKRMFPEGHIEQAYGTVEQNRDYIRKAGKWAEEEKADTSVPGTFEEWGEMPEEPGAGYRTDIADIYGQIYNGASNAEIMARNPEAAQNIPLSELYPLPNHPFSVRDDDDIMKETLESVKARGILTPAIARPREGGGYELVAGHRRKRACELAGLDAMPVIVRDLDQDSAIIMMVDTNIQRENISPIEKAKALKMKMEALKRQAGRPPKEHENNSPQVAANFRSDDEAAKGTGMSGDTVRRLVRLTELSPALQQMVEDRKIAVTPASEISYLKPEEQALLVETIESEQATPLSTPERFCSFCRTGNVEKWRVKVYSP